MTSHQNSYSLFIDQIQQMLDNLDTIKIVYKEIKLQGYSGSYNSLCEYLKRNPIHVNSTTVKETPFLSARKISIYLGM